VEQGGGKKRKGKGLKGWKKRKERDGVVISSSDGEAKKFLLANYASFHAVGEKEKEGEQKKTRRKGRKQEHRSSFFYFIRDAISVSTSGGKKEEVNIRKEKRKTHPHLQSPGG